MGKIPIGTTKCKIKIILKSSEDGMQEENLRFVLCPVYENISLKRHRHFFNVDLKKDNDW